VDTWLDTALLDTGPEGSRPEVFWSGELSPAVSKGAICCYIGCYSLICYGAFPWKPPWKPPPWKPRRLDHQARSRRWPVHWRRWSPARKCAIPH